MSLNILFITYILTIVVTRIFLKLFPIHGHKIGNFQPHHYMHGIILLILSLPLHLPILLAIGSAWIVDEIPLFFIFKTWNWPDDHWKQYHSMQSILGIAIISILFFALIA